ncbi:hypothetical protein L7F22_012519 [Adiantum nelumboides]|nr:hypothetical protein [Adiantum nelumboides]
MQSKRQSPFLEDGTRKQDDGNDEELLASRATLNAEEKKKVKAGAKTRATGRRGEFNSTALRAINPNATVRLRRLLTLRLRRLLTLRLRRLLTLRLQRMLKLLAPRRLPVLPKRMSKLQNLESDSPLTEEEDLKVVDEPKKKQEMHPPGVRRSGRTSIKIHQQMDQDEDEEMSEGEQVGKKVESDEQEDSNSDSEEEDEDDERREISVLQNESDDEETIYLLDDNETFDLSEHTLKKTLKLPSKLVDRLSGTEIKKKGKRAARRNRYQPTQSEEEGPEQSESEFKSLEVLYASDSSHTSDSDDEIEVDDEEVRSSKKKQSREKEREKTDSVPLKKRRVSKEVVVKEEEDLSVSELESEPSPSTAINLTLTVSLLSSSPQRLLAGGAILSRGLVQAVATAFIESTPHHHAYRLSRTKFGKNLTFEAFAAVMEAGAKKFGNGSRWRSQTPLCSSNGFAQARFHSKPSLRSSSSTSTCPP